MNIENVQTKTLIQTIHDMNRESKPYKDAITELRRRKRKAGRKHEPKQICKSRPNQKYIKKYGMNLQAIMKLLDFKYKNTCFDLDNAGLLQHCIHLTKLKKMKAKENGKEPQKV